MMLTAKEIAVRLAAHFTRFERTPSINKRQRRGHGAKIYYEARAWASHGWVRVTYVSYQGSSVLRRADAQKYLAWLDAGHVGKHHQVPGFKR